MRVSMPREKPRVSKKSQARELIRCSSYCSFISKACFISSTILFLLALIYIWPYSTAVVSGNVVRVCVSTRKLNNFYCFSAGTSHQPDLQTPFSIVPNDTSSSTVSTKEVASFGTTTSIRDVVNSTKKDSNGTVLVRDQNASREFEEQLRTHRLWAASGPHDDAICDGRGIYVYELPSKFNKDLLSQCDIMKIPTKNMCKFLTNEALGEPIEKLGKGWYNTHQYTLEPIFHRRVLNHPCRVNNPNKARLFYVPYYGGFDVLRWHFTNVPNNVKDSLAMELVRWLESQESWYKNLGKDHVFVLGKISWDFRRSNGSRWGSRFLRLDEMQNPIKILIERNHWHINDVGVPHPTYFHPHTDDDIVTWQSRVIKSKRTNLVSFAGAPRPHSPDNIRSMLIEQCTSASINGECKFLNCSFGVRNKPESIIGLFMESEFCLQPPGDSPTRKSVFDSLVSGCIPVLFDPLTAYYQYPWHLPEDRDKYSVFIDKEDVRNTNVNVVERLMKIPGRERENMRTYIVYELLPGLVYGDFDSKFHKFQDAFSITINNLLARVSKLDDMH